MHTLHANGGRVTSGHFYDGTEAGLLRLRHGVGMNEDDPYWDCAELVLEVAAGEMASQGYLARRKLDEKLSDGYRDYAIKFTKAGRRMLASGQQPAFRNVELCGARVHTAGQPADAVWRPYPTSATRPKR